MSTLSWMVLTAAIIAWLLGCWAVALIEPRVSGLERPLDRRLGYECLALLPLAWAATMGAGLVVLAASKSLGWVVDHCVVHGTADHPHLCIEHLPAAPVGWWSWLPLLGVMAPVLVRLVSQVRRQWRGSRCVRTLRALSHGPVARVADANPNAFVAGVVKPRIFFSERLLSQLDRRSRRIVIAHEVAHVRARDPIRRMLLDVLLTFQSPRCAWVIRRGWTQASEECADARVADRFGATATALVLLRVMRLSGRAQASPAIGFGGANPLIRIERLQSLGGHEPARNLAVPFAGSLFAVSAVAVGFHHSIETLLGILLGQ